MELHVHVLAEADNQPVPGAAVGLGYWLAQGRTGRLDVGGDTASAVEPTLYVAASGCSARLIRLDGWR